MQAKPVVEKVEEKKKPANKLSYRLQRELEELPAQIEKLEDQVAKFQAQVSDASFFNQPHDVTQKVLMDLAAAEQSFEQAFERWEELEALKNAE